MGLSPSEGLLSLIGWRPFSCRMQCLGMAAAGLLEVSEGGSRRWCRVRESVTVPHVLVESIQTRHEGPAQFLAYWSAGRKIPACLWSIGIDKTLARCQVEEITGGGVGSSFRVARVEPCHQMLDVDRLIDEFLRVEGRSSGVGTARAASQAFTGPAKRHAVIFRLY